MSTRFVGLPVFLAGDERPVGVVEGWLGGDAPASELLVRETATPAAVRRVPGTAVMSAGRAGVRLDLDEQSFAACRLHRQDPGA